MKILYYSPHPHLNLSDPAGYGTHMREMIKAFKELGHDVETLIMGGEDRVETIGSNEDDLSGGTNIKDFIKSFSSQYIWYTLRDLRLILFDKKAEKELKTIVKVYKPDLIYERCNYLQLSGIKVADKYEIDHALEVNSPYLEETVLLGKGNSLMRKWAKKRERDQIKGTKLIVTVSSTLKKYFSEKYNVHMDKFIVTPNGFNFKKINVNRTRIDSINEKYNLSGKKVIGFVGSIFKWHGLDNLIEAFNEIDNKNSKLLIVGYGEYLEELRITAAELERKDDIIFTGEIEQNEVFNYIEVMDICVAPNAAWYQSPIKLFEYGAMGKPIIASKTEPIKEVLENGKDGVLIDVTDNATLNLCSALNQMLDNLEKYKNMGDTFKQKVRNEFTWKINARNILKSLETR